MPKALMIGGPADGEIWDIAATPSGLPEYLQVPTYHSSSDAQADPLNPMPESVDMDITVYRRERVRLFAKVLDTYQAQGSGVALKVRRVLSDSAYVLWSDDKPEAAAETATWPEALTDRPRP